MPGEITPAQIKRIHTIKGALGLTDAQYRAALEFYHVFSCKQLTEEQADLLICELENLAVSQGKWSRSYRKYQHLDGRKGMASARQLRMLEAMWGDVSRADTAAGREAAFKVFLCRWNIQRIEEIAAWQVGKLVKALNAMRGEAK